MLSYQKLSDVNTNFSTHVSEKGTVAQWHTKLDSVGQPAHHIDPHKCITCLEDMALYTQTMALKFLVEAPWICMYIPTLPF